MSLSDCPCFHRCQSSRFCEAESPGSSHLCHMHHLLIRKTNRRCCVYPLNLPRLFSGSPSPREARAPRGGDVGAPPSPLSSGRPCGCLHPARPAESSSRSTAPLARTPAIANRASAPHAPGRPSAAGTPANTAVGSSAQTCPPPPSLRVSTKPGQLQNMPRAAGRPQERGKASTRPTSPHGGAPRTDPDGPGRTA